MAMKLLITSSLSSHRHGRFITGQLGAEVADDLPQEGLLLMHGKSFQQSEQSEQNEYLKWAEKPGCVLLLLPPFDMGEVIQDLDWQIVLNDGVADSDDGVVPNTLAGETSLIIEGQNGDFDRAYGHQWRDFTINTRIFKKHSGTGVVAATCLPLWSISLLELAEETKDWLTGIYAHAGQAGESASLSESQELMPEDFTVLVCFYAWNISSLEGLQARLTAKNSVVSLGNEQATISMKKLLECHCLDAAGISEQGKVELMNSPYWHYAESLKQEEAR